MARAAIARVEPLAVLADAGHQFGREGVGFEDLQGECVGRRDALRFGFVQQVEGAFARVGAFVGRGSEGIGSAAIRRG